jgi:tRNA threonylcarbamoyladenosine biosynthesis protein TsaB
MSLTLAIETSSINYSVAVCMADEVLVARTGRHDEPSFQGIGHLVSSALASAGRDFTDIGLLAVNVGPGNLGSVRAGVAYVNGLAFSLEKKIFCANALNLLALEVAEAGDRPVLCLRNAGSGQAYAGLFRGGGTLAMGRGPLAEIVGSMAGNLDEVWVAGTFRADLPAILPHVSVKDTGVDFPGVRTLNRLLVAEGERAGLVEVASPLTDSSAVFSD